MRIKLYTFLSNLLFLPYCGSGKSNWIVKLATYFSIQAIFLKAKEN
jgi:hypothetical protein